MRVLLDECVPRPLLAELTGHYARTIAQMGWPGKKNGELLQLMVATGFEVLLTVDKSLQHQQNLPAAGVAVILLSAKSNRLVDLAPLMPSVLNALPGLQPGQFVRISI